MNICRVCEKEYQSTTKETKTRCIDCIRERNRKATKKWHERVNKVNSNGTKRLKFGASMYEQYLLDDNTLSESEKNEKIRHYKLHK